MILDIVIYSIIYKHTLFSDVVFLSIHSMAPHFDIPRLHGRDAGPLDQRLPLGRRAGGRRVPTAPGQLVAARDHGGLLRAQRTIHGAWDGWDRYGWEVSPRGTNMGILAKIYGGLNQE